MRTDKQDLFIEQYCLTGNALSEAVRLGAVRDILDRAGYKPVERVESTSRIETASMDDLRRELEALTGSVEDIPDRLN